MGSRFAIIVVAALRNVNLRFFDPGLVFKDAVRFLKECLRPFCLFGPLAHFQVGLESLRSPREPMRCSWVPTDNYYPKVSLN